MPLIVGCSEVSEKSTNSYAGIAQMGAPARYDMDVAMEETVSAKMVAPEMYPIEPYGEGELDLDRKVIKTASLTVEVQDYETASIKALNLAQKYSGFIADSNSYTDINGKKRGHVNIRVPSLHFDAVLIEAGTLGEVKGQTISGDDVTENYMDTEARLNNSRREEERLLAILDKAKDVNEILRVERELSRVRYEIESAQGRLNYLDNHVSYSSVQIELYEPTPVVKEYGIVKAFKDAINYFLATMRFMIRAIGLLLPLIIIGAAALWLIIWARRKKRKR